jgi:outer membrane protein
MNIRMRLIFLLLAVTSLLATSHLRGQEAFKSDGQPDPNYAVPAELTLNYALEFALDNNFTIRQAKERIRQQEGVVLEVRSSQLPNVTGSGGYQHNDREISTTGEDKFWSFDVTARQILYSGGGVSANVKSQKLRQEAAVLSLRDTIDAALLDVRIRFYTVLVNRERIKVQEQNIDLLQRQLQDVKNRFDAGTVSNFEVLRAEVALANAQTPLITARNDYRLSIEELRQSLGFTTNNENNTAKIPEFIGSLDFTAPATVDLHSSLTSAREQRLDLQLLTKLEQASEEGVTVQRAAYYPNLALFGSYDWQKRIGSNSISDMNHGATVGLQSSWAIFDGRATSGRVMQARSLLAQAKLSTEQAQLAVDVDVRRAISSVQQATELAQASQKVVAQAEEALRLANARFSAGTATQLDVLQSQVDLTTARLNQVQAYYSFNVSAAQLRRAIGLSDQSVNAGK